MRVLIATGIYPPDIGGPATYSKLLVDELPQKGINAEVLSFGEVRGLPRVIRHIAYFLRVLKASKNADIIYAQDPVSVGLPAALAASILGKKFLLKVVGDYAWEQYQLSADSRRAPGFITPEGFQNKKFSFLTELRRKVERRVAKMADNIVVPSEYLKKIILMWGVEEKKVNVVYNTFEAPAILESREELVKDLGLSGVNLVSVGRLVPWKGFDVLIKTMPEILKEIPRAKLLIAGDGPEKENLKSLVLSLQLQDSVLLLGQIPHDKVLVYLKASDVFVLNTGYEGLSHLLLEAMSVGAPVVTTAVGGNLEVINPASGSGQVGVLIEHNNSREIAGAIIRIVRDTGLRERLAKNALAGLSRFSKERMLGELINIFKAL